MSEISEARARVDALVMVPLSGLVKKRGVAADAHGKALARLRERLTYLTADNLRALHDLIVRHAVGGVWPDTALILHWALAIQCPPPQKSDYARGLMRSAMGRQAVDEGWAVELFQVAKRLGPPPQKYVIGKLRDQADTNRRRRIALRERIEAGRATPDDVRWLDRWHEDMAEIEAIQSARDVGGDTSGDEGGSL